MVPSRADDAQPRHGVAGREAVGEHQVEGDEGAGAAQAGLAVDGYHAGGAVDDAHESRHDLGGGRRAVLKLRGTRKEPGR